MTYDQWKTTDRSQEYERTGSCDCCDRRDVPLTHLWAYGIETWACEECCGRDDEGDQS